MPEASPRLGDNLTAIRRRIDDAARRVGRRGEDITLVGVTKYVDAAVAAKLVEVGCPDLGESRPQELWDKAKHMSVSGIRWHLVGHLQRNKVRRTLPLVTLIHSVDSLRLMDEINRQALSLNLIVPCLLEINVSGDQDKHGFKPDEMFDVAKSVSNYQQLQLRGLMAMASREGDLEAARRDFRRLREVRDKLRPLLTPTHTLDELSMGMSGDFEVAIEEGATIVRIGSALFQS